jgi:hypothetical protein
MEWYLVLMMNPFTIFVDGFLCLHSLLPQRGLTASVEFHQTVFDVPCHDHGLSFPPS